MQGTRYLSELLSDSDFCSDMMNLLVTPCVSGKTTLFLNKIADASSDKHNWTHLQTTEQVVDEYYGREELILLIPQWYDWVHEYLDD